MPITWRILQTDRFEKDIAQNVVSIEVDFGDGEPPFPSDPLTVEQNGGPRTIKRMTVPGPSEEEIRGAVEGWLRDYIPARAAALVAQKAAKAEASKTLSSLVGKAQTFSLGEPPPTPSASRRSR